MVATLHMSLSVSPIRGTDGRLIGAAHVGRDITAAKQAEATLRESQARLQELHAELLQVSRLSAMGQLAAMVAHELNQPLTAISNYMEAADALLGRGGDLPVAGIRNSIARAGEQAIRAGKSSSGCAGSRCATTARSGSRRYRHSSKKQRNWPLSAQSTAK